MYVQKVPRFCRWVWETHGLEWSKNETLMNLFYHIAFVNPLKTHGLAYTYW